MRESDVVRYLLDEDLIDTESVVDGGLRVFDASRRNVNFRIVRERGPSYFVKAARRDLFAAPAREAVVYELLLAASPASMARVLPKVHAIDADHGILIVELFADAEDLRTYHRRRGRFPKSIAARLGEALAAVHAIGPVSLAKATGQRIQAPEPAGFHLHRPGLPLLHEFSRASCEIVRLIQRSGEVGEAIDALRRGWRADAFIQHDARWDNVLVVRSADGEPSLKLVDWETAGLGDAAWDVGAIFADYLAFWVSSIPVTEHTGLEQYLELARYPLESMRPALHAFWNAYLRAARLDAAEGDELLTRAAAYAGLKLMQSSLEQVAGAAEHTMTAVAVLQLGMNILMRPADAVSVVLAIPRCEGVEP